MEHNGGMTALIAAIPPFSAFFRIFNSLISTPTDGDFPVFLIPIIIPLLLDPMVIYAVFETAKRTPAANRMNKFLTHCAGRQGFNEAHHDTVFMNIIF